MPNLCWFVTSGITVKVKVDQDSREKGKIVTLMAYNLKFANPMFKPSWEVRRDMQVDMIQQYSPDVIGTQKGLKGQIDYLMEQLPDYVVIGEGGKGGDADNSRITELRYRMLYKKSLRI